MSKSKPKRRRLAPIEEFRCVCHARIGKDPARRCLPPGQSAHDLLRQISASTIPKLTPEPASAPRRPQISWLYRGIDADVQKIFFALDSATLRRVFARYEKEHGSTKGAYAERTFDSWRVGQVKMGGDISDRLMRIVPAFLDFEQKYELIEKLWSKFRQKTTLNISISPQGGLDRAVEAVIRAIDAATKREIPSAVEERLLWLTDEDAVAAEVLRGQIARREGEIAVRALETELRQLLAIAQCHQDQLVPGIRVVSLQSATVCIHVTQNASPFARTQAVSNPQGRLEGDEADESKQPPRDLVPIQNPNDLLSEALRRMSPQKQEEIIGKATDERFVSK